MNRVSTLYTCKCTLQVDFFCVFAVDVLPVAVDVVLMKEKKESSKEPFYLNKRPMSNIGSKILNSSL